MKAEDLFAGPGGWDVACRELGIDVVGIEIDRDACRTRRAAGLKTIEGSVLDYEPDPDDKVDGLIASPPCQTFSIAGGGSGRIALERVLAGVKAVEAGEEPHFESWDDERTKLVLEPLKWALNGSYRWIVFEQVPTVLPVWEAMADVLRSRGYSVATGILNAEQFGVPQTRRRAVLIASLDRIVSLPKPTHSRFHSRDPQKLDPGVLPWVSMRDVLDLNNVYQRSNYSAAETATAKTASERGLARREITEPSYAITGKGFHWALATGTRPNAAIRYQGEPAPTLAFGHDAASYVFVSSEERDIVGAKFEGRAVRVSHDEAGILQTFPAGYPWQGNSGQRYQQIGNAVPPVLAAAILRSVV